MPIENCRVCSSRTLNEFISFGEKPLADGLLLDQAVVASEKFFPLDVAWCPDCSLVQVTETVPRETLFCENYPYFSSYSKLLVERSERHAHALIAARKLDGKSLVVELACNDGYLLQSFQRHGIPTLGVEPAVGPCAVARQHGLRVLEEFFDKDVALDIRRRYGEADVLIANNVLAHVENLHDFVSGIRALLKPDGVAVIEVHYLKALIDGLQCDTIYHEHLCYFSAAALTTLFKLHSLYIVAIECTPDQGGSLRATVGRDRTGCAVLEDMLADERRFGVANGQYYATFERQIHALKRDLVALVTELKAAGHSIAAYGAAAKGTMLLNACSLGRTVLDYVADANPHKHGRLMPGVHVPIVPVAMLSEQPPDYLLLLPWNLKHEILVQEGAYCRAGGKFIIPVPVPEIV